MLPAPNRFSAPVVTLEDPFPLGPFPRHIWIHNNTPQDSLDDACHEIWKRVQRLPGELQYALCPELAGTLQRDTVTSWSNSYLLDEPEGLESIYRAVIGNKEREMKLRALCDAQLSAKPVITTLLCSAKSQKNSKGPEDGSVADAHSTEGSKVEVPFLLKHADPAKGAGSQAMAEETKALKEFLQKSMFSSALTSTTAADSQATGLTQQLPPFAEICSKTGSDAVTGNPVITATSEKKIAKYNGSTPGFSTASTTAALQQPVWQSLNFPLFPVFPSHPNFPPLQGPYHQRARILYQQALYPSFGCYSRQVTPYSPQQIFQPPYTPMWNYTPLVQPGYLYQQRTPPVLPSNIQNLLPMAGDGIRCPFPPSYGFHSTPGGPVITNISHFSSESYVKF